MTYFKEGDRVKLIGPRHDFLDEDLTGTISKVMNDRKGAVVKMDEKFLFEGETFSELVLLNELSPIV